MKMMRKFWRFSGCKKAIILLNKSDLTPVVTKRCWKKRARICRCSRFPQKETGLELLEEQIKSMFFAGILSFNDEVYITNIRHKKALAGCSEESDDGGKEHCHGMPEDFFSIDLMNAYEALGTIIGESVEMIW